MIKKIALLVLALAITFSSLSAVAREGDRQRLAACESGLRALYGDDTRLRLKSLSHKLGGTFLRIKTMPSEGDSLVATCRVDREGVVSLTDQQGIARSELADIDAWLSAR